MMVELGCGGWFGKDLEGTFRPFIFHCIAGINNLGILYDGKIASCSNISRDFIEGDARTDNIKEIWDNGFVRFRDREWKRVGKCADCKEWDFCHGGPMHLDREYAGGGCVL
jgi:radical SAM protein with 4Fe4S-binding SPASM domain